MMTVRKIKLDWRKYNSIDDLEEKYIYICIYRLDDNKYSIVDFLSKTRLHNGLFSPNIKKHNPIMDKIHILDILYYALLDYENLKILEDREISIYSIMINNISLQNNLLYLEELPLTYRVKTIL